LGRVGAAIAVGLTAKQVDLVVGGHGSDGARSQGEREQDKSIHHQDGVGVEASRRVIPTALSLSEKKRPDPAEQIGAQRKNEGS